MSERPTIGMLRGELLAVRAGDVMVRHREESADRPADSSSEVHPRPEWRDRAACLGKPMAWWYGDQFMSRVAVAVCKSCPVRRECLADALDEEGGGGSRIERHGIRGGMTPPQRAALGNQLVTG